MNVPTPGEADVAITRTILDSDVAPRPSTVEGITGAANARTRRRDASLLLSEYGHGDALFPIGRFVVDRRNSRAVLWICRARRGGAPEEDLRVGRMAFLFEDSLVKFG